MPGLLHMYPDLMGASGKKIELYQRISSKIFYNFVSCGCRFAFSVYDHRSIFARMFHHRQFNDTRSCSREAPNDAKILFFHLAFLENDRKVLMCLSAFCKHDYTAGFPVQTMNRKNVPIFFSKQVFKRRSRLYPIWNTQ